MGEGPILDPYALDPRPADLLRRVGAFEQRPKVQPALFYQAVPYQSSVAPNASWYSGHTNAALGDSGGSPWAIPLPRVGRIGAYCRVAWTTDAATTGELRLTAQSGTKLAAVIALAAGSSGVAVWKWLHGLTIWQGAVNFDLYARRSGGAGTVYVQAPVFALVDGEGCTLTGV